MNDITVCIPCLNEEGTVAKTVSDWKKALPEAEVVVYDNGSNDQTIARATEVGARIETCQKRGKGNVIRKAFRNETAACLVIVDGDDTYGTECARKIASDILEGRSDMSVGIRSDSFRSELSISHDLGNRLVRWLVNRFFRAEYSDVMSGCRAFSQRFRRSFPALKNGFETETEMNIYAAMAGMKVTEYPLSYRNRKTGSKVRTLTDGLKIISEICREGIRWKRLQKKS